MRGVCNVRLGEPRRSLAATQALWRRVSWSDVASRNSGCPCTGTQAPFRSPHQAEEHGTHNTDAAERKLARRSPIPKCTVSCSSVGPPLSLSPPFLCFLKRGLFSAVLVFVCSDDPGKPQLPFSFAVAVRPPCLFARYVFTGIGSCWSVPLGSEEKLFCNCSHFKGVNQAARSARRNVTFSRRSFA